MSPSHSKKPSKIIPNLVVEFEDKGGGGN